MDHPPPLPPRPPTSKDVVESFVSSVVAFQQLAKKDPQKFKEVCEYVDSEIARFGKLHEKTNLNPQLELIQETLNLNRRLSIMTLLLNYLRLFRW